MFEVANAGKIARKAMITALKAGAYFLQYRMKYAVQDNDFGWEPLAKYTRSSKSFERPRKTGRRWKKGAQMLGAGKTGMQQPGNTWIGSRFANATAQQWKKQTRRAARMGQRNAKTKGIRFLNKMRNIFRYSVYENQADPAAAVGVLKEYTSAQAVRIFDKFQTGGAVEFRGGSGVSSKVQGLWGALGMPINLETEFYQPPRPLLSKLYQRDKKEVDGRMKATFATKFAKLAQGIK